MYSNWDQWFREREPVLLVRPEFSNSMYGRPRVDKALSTSTILDDDDEEL